MGMDAEQFKLLLAMLREIAEQPYTITGASDWAAFAWMAGICQALLFGTLGIMWRDLRESLSAGESRWQKSVDDHEKELDQKCADQQSKLAYIDNKFTKITDGILDDMEKCQGDCCPRGGKG